MTPGPSETQLHNSVAELLDLCLLPPAFYSTFPAGGYALSAAGGGLLKRRGLKAGVPDLLLFYDGRTVGIELKVGKNKPSPAQIGTLAKLRQAGIHCYICRDIDKVIEVLEQEGFPLMRAKVHRTALSGARSSEEPTRESLL